MQLPSHEGEPGRYRKRGAWRREARQEGRVARHGLAQGRRHGRHIHIGPCRRHRVRHDKVGSAVPRRAHSQVQPSSAHRGETAEGQVWTKNLTKRILLPLLYEEEYYREHEERYASEPEQVKE